MGIGQTIQFIIVILVFCSIIVAPIVMYSLKRFDRKAKKEIPQDIKDRAVGLRLAEEAKQDKAKEFYIKQDECRANTITEDEE